VQEPLTTELHCPIVPQTTNLDSTLHCLILHDGQRINSCCIPEMHVVIGTKFVVERVSWRIEQVECGTEGFDRVLICAREYS